MKGILIDQAIFCILLEKYLPDIMKKFKKCHVDCSMFSIQWFVCLFCKNFNQNKEVMNIVFDNLFIQGNVALFKIGIAVLKLLKPKIMSCKDFPHLLKVLEEEIVKINDGIQFQETINAIYINRTLLKLARDSLRNEEKDEFIDNKGKSEVDQEKIKTSKENCDKDYHFCLTNMVVNSGQTKRTMGDFFLFKQDKRIWNLKKDYINSFGKSKTPKNSEKQNSFSTEGNNIYNCDLTLCRDSLLLVRQEHICDSKKENGKKIKGELFSIFATKKQDKLAVKTPSTITPKNDKFGDFFEGDFEKAEEKEEKEEKYKIKKSMIFLKEKGVFKNMDEGVLEKYIEEIKVSPSFSFNETLLQFRFDLEEKI